jgi:hypothetical protein
MDYNTIRNKLVIPEYGRNVQKMVDYAITVDDREKRTKIANLIVNVMGQLSPASKDTADHRHKLWDHLHYISDFRLDVDSPYPVPAKDDIIVKISKVSYPHKIIKFPHYGNNIQLLIERAISFEEGPQKDIFIKAIANHMKKLYLTWNRESVEDDVITQSLAEMSGGKLKLDGEIKLNDTRDILLKNQKKKFVPKPGSSHNPKSQNRNRIKRDYKK